VVAFDGFKSIRSVYSSAREKSDEFVHRRCKKLHTKGPSEALRAFKYTPSPHALRRYDHRDEQKNVVASRRMHYRRLCAGKYAHSMCGAPKKQNFEEEENFLSVA